ncbi:Adaptor protein Enigma and related PDZ-LIM proteins [Ceraceosorus bombacis]|uniref:Adaptor protein Enigma and related PDZ-LIM proteins n=1 Tax=Ceraceosorus bombacis TaxID=401625 RepID=A0A0P1BTG6_9BASI|nr:Adaptor protein Enigma and related PDZ-LIM proteins [Ceraceosorus bombacis]
MPAYQQGYSSYGNGNERDGYASSGSRAQSSWDSPKLDAEEPAEANFAGFGARKFAEKQRRAAQAAQRQADEAARAREIAEQERWEYERRRAREEEERRAHEEEERMRWEEQTAYEAEERRRQQEEDARRAWEREEAQRHLAQQQREDEARKAIAQQRLDAQHRRNEGERRAAVEREEQARLAAARVDRERERARQLEEQEEREYQRRRQEAAEREAEARRLAKERSAPARSATLDSISTASVHLAYDGSDTLSSSSSLSSRHGGRGDLHPQNILAQANVRETIYEDDYEEDEEELDDERRRARYTAYAGSHDDDTTIDALRSAAAARKTMARATTYEPLPKAKCADCGTLLSFDELVEHTCARAGSTSPLSPLTIAVEHAPAASIVINGGFPLVESPIEGRLSPAKTGTRSPFFDRYARLENKSGRSSPAFNGASGEFDAVTPRASSFDVPRSGTTSAEPRRTARFSPPTTSSPLLAATDENASDARIRMVAERKKQIEAQRAAARSRNATLNGASTEGSASPIPEIAGAKPPGSLSHAKAPSTSSSTSSSHSSLLGRGRDGSSASVSAAITPSSSFDHTSGMPSPREVVLVASVDSAGARSSNATARPSSKSRGVDLDKIEAMLHDLDMSTSHKEPTKPSSEKVARKEEVASRGKTRPKDINPAKSCETRSRNRSEEGGKKLKHDLRTAKRQTKLCSVCLCPLGSSKTPFVERDGKLLCAADYADLYLPKCRKCTKPVEKDAVKSSDGALKGIFHRGCFCCFQCDASFEDGTFYVWQNVPYCSKHYHALAGTLCAGCNEGIEGQCRQTESGEKYHPQCLTCQYEGHDSKEFCRELLDDYYLLNGQRLCEWHARKAQKELEKRGGGQKQIRAQRRQTFLQTLQ